MEGGAIGRQASTAPVSPPSLLDDSSSLCTRLSTLLSHVQNLRDKLHGPSPRDVKGDAAPEPSPSVSRNLSNARALLSKIEDEIQSIDARC